MRGIFPTPSHGKQQAQLECEAGFTVYRKHQGVVKTAEQQGKLACLGGKDMFVCIQTHTHAHLHWLKGLCLSYCFCFLIINIRLPYIFLNKMAVFPSLLLPHALGLPLYPALTHPSHGFLPLFCYLMCTALPYHVFSTFHFSVSLWLHTVYSHALLIETA